MATFEDVVIRVTERGAKETANAIGGIGKASEQTAGAAAALSRVMYSLLGAFSVKVLVDYTDRFQSMGNQLKLVTKNTEEFNKTQERLFTLANQNRTSVDGLTELYTKLAMSQKEVGVSGEQLWRVVDVVSKSIAVAGKSGQAGANGLRQFIQGLVSGKVQGEELRSVLENTPFLAKTLADGLRVPVGALRELGAQGELTSKVVVEALLRMQASVDKEFAKTGVTIRQALTILDNAFVRFIGQSGQVGSASSIVSQGIVFLAQNIDKVAFGVIAATAAWVGYAAAVRLVAAAQWLANAAIAANPVVRLVAIVATGVAALIAFTTEWKTIVEVVTRAGLAVVELFKWISEGVTGAIAWFTQLSASIDASANSLSASWGAALTSVTEYLGSWVTWLTELVTVTIPGYWNTGIEMVKKFFIDGFTSIRDFIVGVFDFLKTTLDNWVKSALSFINRVIDAAKSAANAILGLGGGGGSRELAGARAEGGPVSGGKTYLVGENGPELFTPNSSGNIIPNGGSTGSSAQLRSANDNASSTRSQRMLEETFRAALQPEFESLRAIGNQTNVRLDKLIELGQQTASATTSLNNTVEASSSTGSTASGTSAINNFGIGGVNTGTTVTASNGMPTYANTTATGGGAGGSNAGYWVSQLAKALADEVTGLRAGSQSRVAYIKSQIPSDILDEVTKQAQRKVFGTGQNATVNFRTGGQLMVPGGTGVDSKVIPIRATPGEEVTVRTRKQQRDAATPMNTGDVTINFNIETPDANSFRQSETQVLREFSRKASAAMRK